MMSASRACAAEDHHLHQARKLHQLPQLHAQNVLCHQAYAGEMLCIPQPYREALFLRLQLTVRDPPSCMDLRILPHRL